MILRWNHPVLCYIEIFPVRSPPVPAAADRRNAEEIAVPFFCISAQKEVCAMCLHRLPFAFSEQSLQAAFCSLYMHLQGKSGVFRGEQSPLTLGFQ